MGLSFLISMKLKSIISRRYLYALFALIVVAGAGLVLLAIYFKPAPKEILLNGTSREMGYQPGHDGLQYLICGMN